jgi:hypothetical protein
MYRHVFTFHSTHIQLVAVVHLRRAVPEKLSEKGSEPGRHECKMSHRSTVTALHLVFVTR